ncbi:hypothetical protein KW850_29480 [Bacillus sp. sid0103]|uniref:hypothetical protein n=1 Tax=Bacillus sp. sid0103 TaxID=2856337 RepID=UPI001C45346F|nr:hypothetical protein [Bacillus sp. sid0103]MBV7509310.1 hypothetical protein [Bacillus sp. sid0103]
MSKTLYTEFQIKELEKNPNILSASDRSISYNPEFKIKAIKEYKLGKSPTQIFIEHGFNLIKGSQKNVLGAGRTPLIVLARKASLRNAVEKEVRGDPPNQNDHGERLLS